MALIEAYESKQVQITPMWKEGGFDAATGEFKKFSTFTEVHEILDVLTAGIEAGAIDTDTWVSQIFASTDVFGEFLNLFEEYDEWFHINDRWYTALHILADYPPDEVFVTSLDIATKLREIAEETGQI